MGIMWPIMKSVGALGVLIGLAVVPALADPGSGPPGLKRAMEVQQRHADSLLTRPGVVGTAVGLGAEGGPVVKIFTERAGMDALPKTLDGVPVVEQVTGRLYAITECRGGLQTEPACDTEGAKGKGSKVDPKDQFPRPVPIGVSTGNWNECSAGTIAARLTGKGQEYALSNNHLYARENAATTGEDILQPGRYDTNCSRDQADIIGQLADFEPLVFSPTASNIIDAAIALSSTGNLGNATPVTGYGLPKHMSASTDLAVETLVGQAVQKYGRTTALTKGIITAVNAIINIGFDAGTARFVDQVIVESGRPFVKAGDSGSLVVTDPGREPRGLLFAGDSSGKFAIVNRIDRVLERFGLDLDGE